MKRTARLLSAIFTVLIFCVGVRSGVAATPDTPVLAQELQKVRASGKVLTALWTARPDSYSLQLVFPTPGYMSAPPQAARIQTSRQPAAAPVPAQPVRVQVWLLKPDGTQVFWTRRSPDPRPEALTCGRCVSYSFDYSFPLAAGKEAVAVAIRINDDFYIDQLKPLRD